MDSEDDETGGGIDTSDQITILLVAPNPGETRLFTETVTDANLTNPLYAVPDATAARDFVNQRGEYDNAPRPDLVLLEPELPGTHGEDVIFELKAEPALSDIPIIVLVGSNAEAEIVKQRDLDADHYIQKPIKPDEFIDVIKSVEDFWLVIVQQPSADD